MFAMNSFLRKTSEILTSSPTLHLGCWREAPLTIAPAHTIFPMTPSEVATLRSVSARSSGYQNSPLRRQVPQG